MLVVEEVRFKPPEHRVYIEHGHVDILPSDTFYDHGLIVAMIGGLTASPENLLSLLCVLGSTNPPLTYLESSECKQLSSNLVYSQQLMQLRLLCSELLLPESASYIFVSVRFVSSR